ncbi:MAG TPA: amidase [Rhodospirillaceae bacterium]|nr:amidase [Candidatus Neomarinimicrobiota bacterium]HCX15156.1 amidase [Rhodospirillaceae bacterium]
MNYLRTLSWSGLLTIGLAACPGPHTPYLVKDLSIDDIAKDLAEGRTVSETITQSYIERINDLNPSLNAIIAIAPDAIDQARASDVRRKEGKSLGPLEGIPILLKDNIDAIGMPTTAGSLALANNYPRQDAPLVRNLKNAGAVILGKTNLSEWANFRSSDSSSGWSAVGGISRNPHDLTRTACGSSSGSGVATAVSLAAATVGTETDGSVTCPASINGIVGLKPTVGLISRSGIIPISASQDTAGAMARTVEDTAALLTAMAGSDPSDLATVTADTHRTDYKKFLDANALNGVRIGVLRFLNGYSTQTLAVFETALQTLVAQGVELVEIKNFNFGQMGDDELTVLLTEFKVGLNTYLADTPPRVTARTLTEIITFNLSEPRELAWFGQNLFEESEATKGLKDTDYIRARETTKQSAGPDGIDRLLYEYNTIALIAPTTDPAWVIDPKNGDISSPSATRLPAVSGYPHLTVPMGFVDNLPIGLSFMGPAWSEGRLLALGYAFEQATSARRAPPDPPQGDTE